MDVSPASKRHIENHKSAILNALIGSVELNILSYLPLLDPVEKNRLKKLYIQEDQQHLHRLLTAFEYMRITMHHQQLGQEIVQPIRQQIVALEQREQTLSKKVALRPATDGELIYSAMVKDINHFLRTCCHPRSLLELIDAATVPITKDIQLQQCNETIKRMELWISNAEQFQYHTLAKYSAYYRDFLNPLENSISQLKYGFNGLMTSLIRNRDCVTLAGTPNADAVAAVLENLIEFPSVTGLKILSSTSKRSNESEPHINMAAIVAKLEQSDTTYFT